MGAVTPVGKNSSRSGQRPSARVGGELVRRLAARYRALKRRIRDMLMRGDRDYSILSALSQEIGRIRQRIRADLREGRDKRVLERAARKATPRALPRDRKKAHEA